MGIIRRYKGESDWKGVSTNHRSCLCVIPIREGNE